MKIPIPEGLFVTIDGMGEGKAMQAVMLAQHFSGKGVICTFSKEPILEDLPVPASLDDCLWASWQSRLNHSERSVLPTLKAQGIAILELSDPLFVRRDPGESMREADFGGLSPDLQIVLNVPQELCVANGTGARQSHVSRNAREGEGARKAIVFHRERAEMDDNVVLIAGSGSVAFDHERIRYEVVRAAVGKIARNNELNADTVNSVIRLLENNEEIWGLWPELDEVLAADPSWPTRFASLYDHDSDESKIIPLHS